MTITTIRDPITPVAGLRARAPALGMAAIPALRHSAPPDAAPRPSAREGDA